MEQIIMSYEMMCKQLFWFHLCFCDKYHDKKQIRLGKGMFHPSLRTGSWVGTQGSNLERGIQKECGLILCILHKLMVSYPYA